MAKPQTDSFENWEKGKKGAAAKKRKGPPMSFHGERGGKKGWITEIRHKNMDEGTHFGPDPTTMAEHSSLADAHAHIAKVFGEPAPAPAAAEPAPNPDSQNA